MGIERIIGIARVEAIFDKIAYGIASSIRGQQELHGVQRRMRRDEAEDRADRIALIREKSGNTALKSASPRI